VGIATMQKSQKDNSRRVREEVLSFLLNIPKGKIVTYKTLAEIFNLHPRTIGKILSSNAHPEIYPCYKVVRSDGFVGGYNRGIRKKIEKLKKEGIEIDKRGRIKNLERYLYLED